MKDVPILFYAQGNMPETIDGMFKNGTGRMRPTTQSEGAGFTGIYRNDDGTGVYKPESRLTQYFIINRPLYR